MFENELRCPHCHKLIGRAEASHKSTAKVSLVAPKTKSAKCGVFENKCPKCKKIVYIKLDFS